MIRTLPLLYSVCGTAQACAAVEACEQALGIEADSGRRAAREMLVWFETAREHIWRILLDWSGFLGQPPDSAPVAAAMGLFADFRAALYPDGEPFRVGQQPTEPDRQKLEHIIGQLEQLLEHAIYLQAPNEWLEMETGERLSDWLKGCGSIPAQLFQQLADRGWGAVGSARSTALPELTEEVLEARLSGCEADTFIALPTHEGYCCETSSYTRMRAHPLVNRLSADHGSGLLPRMLARLVELAGVPGRCGRALAIQVAVLARFLIGRPLQMSVLPRSKPQGGAWFIGWSLWING